MVHLEGLPKPAAREPSGEFLSKYKFTFGQYKGVEFKSILTADPGYLNWMAKEGVKIRDTFGDQEYLLPSVRVNNVGVQCDFVRINNLLKGATPKAPIEDFKNQRMEDPDPFPKNFDELFPVPPPLVSGPDPLNTFDWINF